MTEPTTITCKSCGSVIEENSPGAVAVKIAENIPNWARFESASELYGLAVNSTVDITNLPGIVRVEAKKIKPSLDDLADGGYYAGEDEYPQGTEFEVYVILSYVDRNAKTDKMYFKKTGTADSYGDITWGNGPLMITQPKQVTVTQWA